MLYSILCQAFIWIDFKQLQWSLEKEISKINSNVSNLSNAREQNISGIEAIVDDTKKEILKFIVMDSAFQKEANINPHILNSAIDYFIDDKSLLNPISELRKEISHLEELTKLIDGDTL